MGDFVGEAVTEFHRYTFEVAATVAPEFTRAGGQSPLEPAAVVVADVPHQVIIGGTPAIRSDTADATLAGRNDGGCRQSQRSSPSAPTIGRPGWA